MAQLRHGPNILHIPGMPMMAIGHVKAAAAGGTVERHATLPGSSPNYFYSTDAAETHGDWTLVVQMTTDWTPAAESFVVSQYQLSGSQRSWTVSVRNAANGQRVYLSANGSSATSMNGNEDSFADDTEGVIRYLTDLDNGSSQKQVSFHTWNGSSWDLLNVRTSAGEFSSLFDSSDPIVVGGYRNGATLSGPITATIKRMQMFSGLVTDGTPFGGTGTLEWDFNPNDYSGSGSTWVSSTTGETWTITGTASVDED